MKTKLAWAGIGLMLPLMTYAITSSYAELHPKIMLELAPPRVEVYYTMPSKGKRVKQDERRKGADLLFKLLYQVESKGGKLRYRPSNKEKSCSIKHKEACGYHQLTSMALKQIGCVTPQCYLDRDNETKSEAMARKYLAWQAKAFDNHGLLFQYLAYNQGGSGIGKVYAVAEGKRKYLGRKLRRRMINNLPDRGFYRKLNPKALAQGFIGYWAIKVDKELKLLRGNNGYR